MGVRRLNLFAMKAVSAIEFLSEISIKKHGLSIEGRVAILEEIKVYIAAIQDSTARSLYIREIAYRLGIDESAVVEKVRQTLAASNKSAKVFNSKIEYLDGNNQYLNGADAANRDRDGNSSTYPLSSEKTSIPREQRDSIYDASISSNS